jgi:hypothetical protein
MKEQTQTSKTCHLAIYRIWFMYLKRIRSNYNYRMKSFEVEDIIIKTEDIPKLFGSFVRLQTPLTEKTQGTGLGLYLVKKPAKKFLGGGCGSGK